MGSAENRLRNKWQDYSGKNAIDAEIDFFNTFNFLFENTELRIRSRPNEFKNIYVDLPLDKKTLSQIYSPTKKITRHGVYPDYAIDNLHTSKSIYVEVKRQDGWVEGKKRSDGRGNAHERASKYFTPGLQKILRKEGNLSNDVLPFWIVFQGDITRDPCRVREITCWFDIYKGHFFFWRNSNDPAPLIDHFEKHIQPLLL